MIRNFEIKQTGNIDKRLNNLYTNFPLSKFSRKIQQDNVDEAERRGWSNIQKTVKRRILSRFTHEVYLGGSAKWSKIGVFLQRGTKPHTISAKKSVLHWLDKSGKDRFAKFVKHPGTPALNWFTVHERTLSWMSGELHKTVGK